MAQTFSGFKAKSLYRTDEQIYHLSVTVFVQATHQISNHPSSF